MAEIVIKEGRTDAPIFIHSELDDYGLTPIEFRVYSRLARRAGAGGAYESVPKMATEFGVSDRTVQRALRVLSECHLISEEPRPGMTTRYILLPRSKWLASAKLDAVRARIYGKTGDTTTPRSHVTGDMRDGGGVTPETDEGTPLKVLPISLSTHAREETNIPDPSAHPANKLFAEIYEQPATLKYQADIAATVADLPLWRKVLRRQKLNGTPAKNVGTLLEIYQDRIANGFGSGGNPRAAPSTSTPDRQRELKQRYEGKTDARTATSTQH